MKSLLVAITLFTSSAFAGSYEFVGAMPLGSCTTLNIKKDIIESEKSIIETLEKTYNTVQSEEKKLKYAAMIEKSKASLKKTVESLQYDSYVFPAQFVFSGDGSYKLKYPQKTVIEDVELINYEVNTLGSQFIQFTDETHFITAIPGSWSVSVELSSRFVCEHPSNSSVEDIDEAAIKRAVRDFFIQN